MQNVNKSLNESLQSKYPHLELSVLSLSQVQKDNESKRIDSEYFKKEYLENEKMLLHFVQFDEMIELLTDGKHGGVTLTESGVLFLRNTNIKDGFIDIAEPNYISQKESNETKRAEFKEGDILLSTIGTVGLSAVVSKNFPKATINQSLVRIVLKDEYLSGFVSTFLNCYFGRSQVLRMAAGNVYQMINYPNLRKIKIPILPKNFQLEIQNLVQDSHKALEDSKVLYKEAENLLYEALGLDSHNPLASLRDSRFISSLRESANADSWQSTSYNNDEKTHAKALSAREGEQTICHTESVARSISNNPQNRDISPFSQAQYDNLDSSLSTKAQNDNVMDCHENSNELSRNDTLSCHTRSPLCHTEPSEVSKNTNTISQNHLDSSLRASHFSQNDNVNSPSRARSDSQFSPSLAEGVRGWVEKYPHLNLSIRPLSQSYGISGRLDSEYYQAKYDLMESKIKGYQGGYCKLQDLVLDYSGGFAFSSDDYLKNGDLALIRIANIKNADLDMSNAVYLKNSTKDLSPKDKVKQGDILISMSGSIGLLCVIREKIEAMTNQRILKITIKDFNGEVLVLLLNSIFCKLQFERIGTGGVQTNISSGDILNILIPKINSATQEQIASKIQKSFALRKKSKDLLQSAKAKVEQNIENSAK